MTNPQILTMALDQTHYWPGDVATLYVQAADPDARTITVTVKLDDPQGGAAEFTTPLTMDQLSVDVASLPPLEWEPGPSSVQGDVTTYTFRAVVPYLLHGVLTVQASARDQAGNTDTRMVTATVLRFVGDVGPGWLRFGSTTYMGSGATSSYSNGRVHLDSATGKKFSIERTYSTAPGGALKRTGVNSIGASIDAGCLPFHSTKLGLSNNPTPAEVEAIVNGSKDEQLRADADWCAQQGVPMWIGIYHEGEDNFPSDELAALYRQMWRRVVRIFREEEAFNVAFVHITMCPYTYLVDGGEAKRGPWFNWDPDWKGTRTGANGAPGPDDWHTEADAVVDIIGLDQYCPEINSTKYRSFPNAINPALDRMMAAGRPARPWCVPEGGTKAVTSTSSPLPAPGSGGWGQYYSEMIDYMLDDEHGWPGVAYIVYNTDANNMLNAPAAAERLAGLKSTLERDELAWRAN